MRIPKNLVALHDENHWALVEGHAVYLVYLTRGSATKPYISALAAPSGRNLLADSPYDHLHHHGVWWGHGDVNGVTFYLELPHENPGRIVHRRWTEQIRTSERIGFVEELDWIAPSGERLICETRRVTVAFVSSRGYTVDLENAYVAQVDIRFGTTKESAMPLIRLADAFNGRSGGVIVNSEGNRGEGETFGVPARWVDYHAPVPPPYGAHRYEGLACLDHPQNPDHPNRWFTREYGPLSPREGNYFVGETELKRGETLHFRHRLYVHEGDEVSGDVEGEFQRFAAT